MRAQVVDERLAGSSVEYLQLNELSDALQRNLQSMHLAKCLFMMRAWHQARPHACYAEFLSLHELTKPARLQLHVALPPSCTDACLHSISSRGNWHSERPAASTRL